MEDLTNFLNPVFSRLLTSPYEGTREQRWGLRRMTSALIARYMGALRLSDGTSGSRAVEISQGFADEIKILKQITRDYIINVPSLAAQQKGQKNIITELYTTIYDDFKSELPSYLPKRLKYLWDDDIRSTKQRFVADCICNLTEAETLGLYGRLRGSYSGSVLDPIVR